MSEKELIKQIRNLPSEARQEAADFVEFLTKKYTQERGPSDLLEKTILDSSFRGIWKGRDDLRDSTKWVREFRKIPSTQSGTGLPREAGLLVCFEGVEVPVPDLADRPVSWSGESCDQFSGIFKNSPLVAFM